MINCKFCNVPKNFRGLKNHEIRCPSNPNRVVQIPKDLTNIILANKTKIWSAEQRAKHSVSMKRAVLENQNSYSSSNRGRTKQIEKHGLKFQGNWELIYYEWCLKENIKIVRCEERFPYEWKGIRSYNPDFYLPDQDLYIEVKGYETDRDRAKWRDFPKALKIIRAKEIRELCVGSLLVKAVDSH